MNPESELKSGVAILRPLLTENGFEFVDETKGRSSGGPFASGFFQKDLRRLNFSVRYSLGCVSYQLGSEEISHSEYMNAIGVGNSQYPGFSKSVSEAFSHLSDDLNNHAKVFITGSDEEFLKIIEKVKESPKKTGFGALP